MLLLMERVQQEQLQSAGQQIQFAAAWSRQISQYADQARQQVQQSWRQTQQAHDEMFWQFNDYIKDIERYQTSNGTVQQLPAGYQHAWQGANGTVIMTNNALLNPNENENSTQNWNRIQRVR